MQSSSLNEVVAFERDPTMYKPPSPLAIPEDFKASDVSEEAFAAVADDLINDVVLEFCFQVHRASKVGYCRNEATDEVQGRKEEDIFGQTRTKHNINCPHCTRKIEATRFANHLEKCMVGNGRQSSRNARRKIDAMGSDYDDDENESDSSYSSRKKTKKKNTKGAIRKKSKDPTMLSLLEAPLTQASSSVSGSDQKSSGNYKLFFNQYCGVKSRHTKKMCMNSLKCSQHTDIMRADIRKEILPLPISEIKKEILPIPMSDFKKEILPIPSCNEQKIDDVHIDVDTVDEEGGAFYTAPGMSRSSSPEFNSE